MKKHVVICGAGFGGLELATRLTETLSDAVDVTLIDRNDYFIIGFSKFEVMFGRKSSEEIKAYYRDLPASIRFRQEKIESIDPASRRVITGAGEHHADILVVALGADVAPEATPGLVEGGHEFYTLGGAERLSRVLPAFNSGDVLIAILGMPYKCPPAPFEAALQVHDFFAARGLSAKTKIRVLSPAPTPLPVSKQGSEVVLKLFAERGIEFLPGHPVTAVDPAAKQVSVKDHGAMRYDLLMAVPVHRAPVALAGSGLVQEGWIVVNPKTMETSFPDVYALGDVTKIPVGAAMVPKAGAFADRAAGAVAAEIAHRIKGVGDGGQFDGVGACYMEAGGGLVAKIDANFLGGPAPDVKFIGPSPEFRADKDSFASTRLARWFRKA